MNEKNSNAESLNDLAVDKQYIAVLVESLLFKQLNLIEESSFADKEKAKANIMATFMKQCKARFQSMNDSELKEYIDKILERTRKNIEALDDRTEL